MAIEGCGEEGKSACSPIEGEVQKNLNAAANFDKQTEALKCQDGEEIYCSYAENHPAEVAAFTVTGLVTAGTLDPANIGMVYDALGTVTTQALLACARNIACYRLGVALGLLSYYPPNNGFASDPKTITHQPGEIITRYGENSGQYGSPLGSSIPGRALPSGVDISVINGFEVREPIGNVLAGNAQGWFGQPGGAIQLFIGAFGRTFQSLVDDGHLIQLP